MALIVFRDNRWQGDQAILVTMEVDLTHGSQMIYVIPEIKMTIGDFYRNIQISILTRGYEAWQNSEANLLITRGLVGRLSNTPNVGFAYEIQGVVDYLTSHGVKALLGRSFSTSRLQGLNWTINPTQIAIPMQPAEVNSQTMMDGRISLSFSNYAAAQPIEQPIFNKKDEEVYETLAVLIETQPESIQVMKQQKNPSGRFDYYVNYDIPTSSFNFELPPPMGWGDNEENEATKASNPQEENSQLDPQQIEETSSERYSSTTEPHILINKISQYAVTPTRQTEGSAGLDIVASHASIIEPYGRDLIHTGLRIEIPYGYYGHIASRFGLAWKSGIEVGAGVIDSDFRGEVQVLLFNRTNLPIFISSQQCIAQLIIEKIAMPEVYEVSHISYTERGNKGFGSTDHHVFLPKDEASPSHEPRKLTTEDIFSLLLPQEKIAALLEEGLQNSFEQDHVATTSPGASVPHSMETTLSYEEDTDSYLDYIQYLSSLSNTEPKWDTSSASDIEWTNPFASEGGGRQEKFIEIIPAL
ncbi:hypothetical protein ZIOFF_024599 [Zingiber officinale]|uniref:dUTP diphosphatase n=1 Tax=Zingiber officinale TaxID=94328 RepID=A0A8J5GSP1_ZINOF|nr:hypothetical protein ZIOFF_024599 [Zingiber officinale]